MMETICQTLEAASTDLATSEQIDNTLEQEKYTDWIPKEAKSRNQSWLTWLDVRSKCKTRFLRLLSRLETGLPSVTYLESRVLRECTRVLERNTGPISVRCIPSFQRECNTSLIAILGPRLSTWTVH